MIQKSLLQRCSQPAFMNLAAVQHRDFAVSEKQLKIRMKSVGSIKKITKAMKMVSASKMKGDLRRLDAGKHFGCDAVDQIFKSDQFLQRKMPGEIAEPAQVFVPITSDKGLCGGTNSNIVRTVRDLVNNSDRSKYQVFVVGDKGVAGLNR